MKPMQPMKPMEPMQSMRLPDHSWWPSELSDPSSTGAQNDMQYAFFPKQRRLVVNQGGRVTQYDAGSHQISGVSQAQGSSEAGARFSSQHGEIDLASLTKIS
jgi:hypothetical protein